MRLRETSNNVKRSLRLIPSRDRARLLRLTFAQVFINLLDLLGVALFGVMGAVAINGLSSRPTGTRVGRVEAALNISHFQIQSKVALLGLIVALVLGLKTAFSIILTRRTLIFLSTKSAEASSRMLWRVLSDNLYSVQGRGVQKTSFMITTGISSLVLSVVGGLILVVSDLSLLLILTVGLFVVNPVLAFSSFMFFVGIGFSLYVLLNVRAQNLGRAESRFSVITNEKLVEVLSSFREAVVRNRREYYYHEISKIQKQGAVVIAEKTFIPNITKYVLEISVLIGALLICGIGFLLQDSTRAIASLAIFMAAGTRIAPAALRIQQSLVQMQISLGVGLPALSEFEDLAKTKETVGHSAKFQTDHFEFAPDVLLTDVGYEFSENSAFSIKGIDISCRSGQMMAVVGPSGAGKTTLVDLILGIVSPTSGKILISGESPAEAVRRWPGAISYVPQDILIVGGTVRENIILGYQRGEVPDSAVWEALESASLGAHVRTLPDGLDSQVGERGVKFSGGQRQRLGIARALLTQPRLLVLDEATSALDAETESSITQMLEGLKSKITVIIIAHRLSTIQNADRVVYLEGGLIRKQGTIDEVQQAVPNFEL